MSKISSITVREVSLDEAAKVNKAITEFDPSYDANYFEERIEDSQRLVIVAYVDDKPAGYLIGYDRDHDGSFYCWMAGVNPNFRRMGALTALMSYEDKWAIGQGYDKLKIKTLNSRREMLTNLVKKGFIITEVIPWPDPMDSRICLEISLKPHD